MTEIGRELRQARQAAGRTLEEISGVTMVSLKHLRALELEDWTAFPGEVYLKGALRKYAGEVGVDPAQAVAWYEATRTSRLMEEKAVQQQVKPLSEKERVGRVVTRRLNKRRLFLVLSVPLLAGLLLRFAYSRLATWESLIQPPPPPPPVTAPVADPSPAEPQVPLPPPEPDVLPMRIERDPAPGVVAFNVYGADGLQAILSFSERCWVAVAVDGRTILEQNFSAGQTYQALATNSIRLRIGYPPGMTMSVNGLTVELPAEARPLSLEIRRR